MEETGSLSKRQQRKLDQTIKLINSMEAQEAKYHDEETIQRKPQKKRKTSTKVSIIGEPAPKASAQTEELEHAADTSHLTPEHQKPERLREKQKSEGSQHQEKHLNPCYPLPDGDLSSYLICYQYSEQQKLMSKENSEFSEFKVMGELLEVMVHPKTQSLMGRVMETLRKHENVIGDHPFSRHHLELSSKLSSLRD